MIFVVRKMVGVRIPISKTAHLNMHNDHGHGFRRLMVFAFENMKLHHQASMVCVMSALATVYSASRHPF
jgi:hypothetical protein